MKVLVSNVGSTSLKLKLFDMADERLLCDAKVERIGSKTDAVFHYHQCANDISINRKEQCIPGYSEGIRMFLDCMTSPLTGAIKDIHEIRGIGFKTVLAKSYYGVHVLDEKVLQGMRDYLFIAPAHNTPYLEAINMFQELLPDALMVGVFETAFHTTIPQERKIYSIPYEWYEKYGIMRMGYHGASHSFISQAITNKKGSSGKLISCHLGGSCSLCAIDNGKSVDTSFGFSLQTGIPHANRVGDTDPYIVPFLLNEGLELQDILEKLGRESGLLGVSGVSNDLRDIEDAANAGNQRAQLAIDTFVYSIIKYIGSFYAVLGGLDNLVFTGGIGENSATIRKNICDQIAHMGVWLDKEKNLKSSAECRISTNESPVDIWVMRTNEEIGIARQTYRFLQEGK